MKRLKILLIEDNPYDAEQIMKAFKSHDMKLCENFNQFLLEKTDGLDAIICDYGLESVNGREFTAIDVFLEMARKGIKMPMILITGREDPDLKKQMLDLGMAAFFTKGKIWKMPNLITGVIDRYWTIENEYQLCRAIINRGAEGC